MHRCHQFVAATALLLLPYLATSANASLVDNFELLDQRGDAHELYYPVSYTHLTLPTILLV